MVNTECLSGKISSNKTNPQTDETPPRLEDSITADIVQIITAFPSSCSVSHLAASFGLGGYSLASQLKQEFSLKFYKGLYFLSSAFKEGRPSSRKQNISKRKLACVMCGTTVRQERLQSPRCEGIFRWAFLLQPAPRTPTSLGQTEVLNESFHHVLKQNTY